MQGGVILHSNIMHNPARVKTLAFQHAADKISAKGSKRRENCSGHLHLLSKLVRDAKAE